MKIFISDSTSCMGKRILHHAIQRGHEVCVFCSALPSSQNAVIGVQYIISGNFNTVSLKDAVKGCEAIIHSAGLDTGAHQRGSNNPYLTAVQQLIQCAAESDVQRIVFALPCAVMGPTSEKPANESCSNHTQAGYVPSRKIARLYETDQWLRSLKQHDFSLITVYPGMLYGPGMELQHSFINRFMNDYIHRRLYGIPGKGSFRWTFSYIEDVAKGVLLALEKGKQGERYILGGEDASLQELIEILEALTRLKGPRIHTPLYLLNAFVKLEQCKTWFSQNYAPAISSDILIKLQHHWRFSSQKAIADLGYSRTPLKIGIIKTLESLQFNFPSERDMIL